MTESLPRGIRNNNPGNIRHSRSAWEGMAPQQPDSDFVMFVSPEFGIRAMARNLLTYQTKYGLSTIDQIVHRWSPPVENATAVYVLSIVAATGIRAERELRLSEEFSVFASLVTAMITVENGPASAFGREEWYDRATIDRGIAMALDSAADLTA